MRIIKKVNGNSYLTFREYDQETKTQNDVSCGREGTLSAEQKYIELERERIKQKIKKDQETLDQLQKQYEKLKSKLE